MCVGDSALNVVCFGILFLNGVPLWFGLCCCVTVRRNFIRFGSLFFVHCLYGVLGHGACLYYIGRLVWRIVMFALHAVDFCCLRSVKCVLAYCLCLLHVAYDFSWFISFTLYCRLVIFVHCIGCFDSCFSSA